MADPLLAAFGMFILVCMGIGAFIAMIVCFAQIFIEIFRAIGLIKPAKIDPRYEVRMEEFIFPIRKDLRDDH